MQAVSQLGYSSKPETVERVRELLDKARKEIYKCWQQSKGFAVWRRRGRTHRGVNIFEEGKPMWQILLVFLVPLMLSNVLQSASQTMASIWIGRLISTQALGAVSAVFPIIFLLFSFVFGVSSGSSVLVGQAFGAKDFHKVKKVAGTVLGRGALSRHHRRGRWDISDRRRFLGWLATPPDIIAQSDAYARVVFLYDAGLFRLFRLCDDLAGHRRLDDAVLRAHRFERAGHCHHADLYRRSLRLAEARASLAPRSPELSPIPPRFAWLPHLPLRARTIR